MRSSATSICEPTPTPKMTTPCPRSSCDANLAYECRHHHHCLIAMCYDAALLRGDLGVAPCVLVAVRDEDHRLARTEGVITKV